MRGDKTHTYKGTWSQEKWYQVTIDDRPFDPKPSQKIRNHSPDGFSWGYSGSGPAQLALAILLKETDRETAERLYQIFKDECIACLSRTLPWTMKSGEVQVWIEDCLSRLNTLQKEQR